MATYFSGRVSTIIFENAVQNFYIVKMVLDGHAEPVTVRGTVIGIQVCVGAWFGFDGDWVFHEKHGRQLLIEKAPVIRDWTAAVAASVLKANGVGDRIVSHIHSHFGDSLVDVLDEYDPQRLVEVPGLMLTVAEHVVGRWRVAKAYFRTLAYLFGAGIPRQYVQQVWNTFGDDAETVLSTNPWALVRIDGISFSQADEVASRLGLSKDAPERIDGAVRFVCKTRKGLGHLFITSGDILVGVESLIGSTTPDRIAKSIANSVRQKQLIIDSVTRPGVKAIYEPWFYKIEQDSATLVTQRLHTARVDRDLEHTLSYVAALGSSGANAADSATAHPSGFREAASAALLDWSLGSNVSLSGKQLEGVVNALSEPISIITGLPGTGKSTSLKAVVAILKDAGVSFLLVAPTGIAAKRITAVTGAPASTIHRAFGAVGWDKGEEREASYIGVTGQSQTTLDSSDGSGELWSCSVVPHAADVVVCDEASMVGQHLLYRILTCTKPTARLVFIGDAQQLPSVEPGNVLRDLIASGIFPTTSLTEIFRQSDTSQIVVASHAISRGEVPDVDSDLDGDFVFIPAKTDAQVLDILVRQSKSLFESRSNFQVMSPRHSGTVGVTNINAVLREPLNPEVSGTHEMRLGSEIIRENDRVMVVKNNYEKEIFNGDVGKVQKLDQKTKDIIVKIHGPPIQYVSIPFRDAVDYLRLAYCTTVHKMQGQETDTIILPIVNGFAQQLQRNLLYTAITRAKVRAIIIGHMEAFVKAIQNNRQDERNTLFLDRLLRITCGS